MNEGDDITIENDLNENLTPGNDELEELNRFCTVEEVMKGLSLLKK